VSGDRITYAGHATVLAQLGGTRLLTDPLLRRRVGHLLRRGPVPRATLTARLDAVLVSHLHHDHADLPSLRLLDRATPLVVPAGAGEFFARRGFGVLAELAPGDSVRVGAIEVIATEADHEGGRPFGRDTAIAVGYLLRGAGRRVYFAGDTDVFAGMEAIGAPGLDLALLPVWGWGPSLGPGHLDPARAAEAAALLRPRIAVPIHWGTYYPAGLARIRPGPLMLPPRAFAARAAELAPQVEVRMLPPGASTSPA
jgi:L-ascorbate metabolism protein UlaG (beta-lactamase superfamily)